MCGIVGLISKKPGGLFSTDLDLFQALLVMDTQRGKDSTGAVSIERNGSASTIKVASHPFHLFACEAWQEFRKDAVSRGTTLIGHNRYATQGAINSANAHPFHEGNIILVHNGTLKNHKALEASCDVDSHAICHAFNEKGHEAVIPTLEGAFALVWYDLKEHKLYMIRNEDRPLHLVFTKDMVAFVSEPWMAIAQFSRRGDKIEKQFMLDKGWLYEFDLKTGDHTTKKLDLHADKEETKDYGTSGYNRVQRAIRGYYNTPDDEWDETEHGVYFPHRHTPPKVTQLTHTPFKDTERPVSVNMEVQAKITRINKEMCYKTASQLLPKAYGSILSPNGQLVDFCAWLPSTLKEASWPQWFNTPLVGKISDVHRGNGGWSVWLENLDFDVTVPTHTTIVGAHTWEHHISGKECAKCKALINKDDAAFTSVKENNDGSFRIICGTCVEQSLPNGEMKDAFIQRRDAALQERESVRQEAVKQTDRTLHLPSPQAVQ